MEDFKSAFKDLVAMISSERDARRADAAEFRAFFRRIENRMDAADERATRFESALIDALGKMQDSLATQAARQDSFEVRLSDLEQWRRDQAS